MPLTNQEVVTGRLQAVQTRRLIERQPIRKLPVTCNLTQCRIAFDYQPVDIGLRAARIQLNQDLTGPDPLALGDMDRRDHADLQRLHRLAVPAGDDAALGDRDDVHLAERGPHQCEHEEQQNRPEDRPARR